MMWESGYITSIVHGGASGVDRAAGGWAKALGLAVRVFSADWPRHGKAAGPIRNRHMIQHVGATGCLILFPGGKGTADIHRQATSAGVPIYDFRQ